MINLFLYSLLIAVVAYVYKNFLAHEPVLNWWFKFGERFHKRWFYAPIWGCEFCFAGQIAFWTYLLNVVFGVILKETAPISRLIFSVIPKYHFSDWSVFSWVIFICLTIFNVWVVSKLKKLLTDEN